VWIASLEARGSPSLNAWMVDLGACGSPPFERMDGASDRVDVPWVTLMGSPSITARLPGVVAQRVHAATGTCITDEHKALGRQRAGATQRGATTSVCASESLCQSFVAEVGGDGFKTPNYFRLFKAVLLFS